jgi:hypothetical protein
MATVFQTPQVPPPPRATQLYKDTLPETVFVDRAGDEWVPNGHTPAGELLLACPQPVNPEDAGVGESFAWTLRLVQAGFGPLIARSAVQS